jgi:hypothetical protein
MIMTYLTCFRSIFLTACKKNPPQVRYLEPETKTLTQYLPHTKQKA